MQLDHSVSRLMVELEEEYLAAMETNNKLVVVKLNTGNLYLIIITAWVPEANLKKMRIEERKVNYVGGS